MVRSVVEEEWTFVDEDRGSVSVCQYKKSVKPRLMIIGKGSFLPIIRE